MKKVFAGIFAFLLCLFCVSCGSMPDMRELLRYQQDGTEFHVSISDGELRFSAVITLGETDTVELLDEGTKGVRFRFGEDKTEIEYDGTAMELSSANQLKVLDWLSLFSLPTDTVWKIRKDSAGSTNVYVCTCGSIVLYIDAATHLPLKITDGDIEIDILSCQSSSAKDTQ